MHAIESRDDTAAKRFERRVDRSDPSGCHLWTGCRTRQGYGHIRIGKRLISTHRFAWELVNGPILNGLFVCHRCDNPPCVNPAHLFLGTNSDNVRDCLSKGRANTLRGERNGNSKLTQGIVNDIRSRYATGTISQRKLAREYGVHQALIFKIVKRLMWIGGAA